MLEALAVLLVLTAFFAWLNERTVRLPATVGVTLAGAIASFSLIALDALGFPGVRGSAEALVEELNFSEFVLGGILSALLFAGALSLDTRQVLKQRTSILTLAIGSTLISTALIGGAAYGDFISSMSTCHSSGAALRCIDQPDRPSGSARPPEARKGAQTN